MKKLLFIVVLFIGLTSNAQNESNKYSSEQIKMFIKEVFADKADELVFQSESNRLEMIQDFLKRVEVKFVPEYKGKKFKSLNEVALQDKYNRQMVRDIACNPSTFNPLKYDIAMFPIEREIYRIAETDYILTVLPVDSIIK